MKGGPGFMQNLGGFSLTESGFLKKLRVNCFHDLGESDLRGGAGEKVAAGLTTARDDEVRLLQVREDLHKKGRGHMLPCGEVVQAKRRLPIIVLGELDNGTASIL